MGHACRRPNVQNMDHAAGSRQMVNRVCLTCGTHWYGEADAAVFEMPRKVWDGWLDSEFQKESKPGPQRSCKNCRHFHKDACHAGEFQDYQNFPLPASATGLCECHEFAREEQQP